MFNYLIFYYKKGEIYWYPIPYLIYGSCSIISAITFSLFMSETKNKKLPDTIEDFVHEC